MKALDFAEIWEDHSAPGMERIRRLKELGDQPEDWKAEQWEVQESLAAVEEVEEQEQLEAFTIDLPSSSRATSRPAETIAKTSKIQVISSTNEIDHDLVDEYNDYDSVSDEDDLQPYALPPAPAAEDLKDLEDPSAYTPNKKKVLPPVYIADLSAMLKQSEDAEKLAVGLKEAESLIRRKAGWGSELGEYRSSFALERSAPS